MSTRASRAAARQALEQPLPPPTPPLSLPPVTLDARGFPYIFHRIVELAPGPTLLRLRATCKGLRERADVALLRHIVYDGESLSTPDGTLLPPRRWLKSHKQHVRVVEFSRRLMPSDNTELETEILAGDGLPNWVGSLEHVQSILCPWTWYLSGPIPASSTYVSTEIPFRFKQGDKLALRPEARIVVFVHEKRAAVELPDFIRDFGMEDFNATYIFCEPENRNRRPGDVIARMLTILGRALTSDETKLNFTLVNTEAWAKKMNKKLMEQMRADSGFDEDEFEGRVRFLTLDEYAVTVGQAQFELEMGLNQREMDLEYGDTQS
ncbi:hypothetical protein CcaverHIS002_0501300 [Cutaneotrichosporon cavernicola]|uniref:Uncharacterized protein n=1 Tax=Cutaneotrichosporon cavernicola TaxID=279322 RepID=A0AA48L819_9TREE|nr:uncharacterized protein CcaverHIS019_0601310 [Cutaneotrichosporon cavernicola]BEI84729.1 hypothetical protein CcaverHIS002_0501300 [Cutaneotrichosporon cavernicola]BEI93672.1 hypothetical protein CcaverHIS019_0601310 [Cutaneotrichosporon cavernicola]BEJ01449.1 hypothetical protein CcaverHIS631_0601310 [Cutaneotrichosporon cavernicola]BEJ09216.1 hypothetical protein CcaverHIS641_0601310 [Cutaneotrichosporon cavernicola]